MYDLNEIVMTIDLVSRTKYYSMINKVKSRGLSFA
jgi:hypothetical protein